MTFPLRDYQTDGVAAIRAQFLAGYRRVLYQLPTGGGKTVLFAHMARAAAERGRSVAVLVHRRELVRQAVAKLDYDCGVIQSGYTAQPHRPIQVASVQTLINRLHRHLLDFIIVDEAHHCTAASYRRILAAYPQAFVLGVTATPQRADGRGLDSVFQALITGPTVRELTAAGYLAPARVLAPTHIDVDGVHVSRGDYITRELEAAADTTTITGDAIAHYRRYADRKPAIAFCVSVSHAKHVSQSFEAAGYRAQSVDGKMDQTARDAAIAALGNGGLDVLTSCDLISEGVDVPVVECGIALRPTKSLPLWIQQMGRILRPSPGKAQATVLDHAGNCVRHGVLPDTEIEWTLEGDRDRGSGKKAAAPVIRVRECPQCYAVHPLALTCPQCGYAYPLTGREVETVDGELTELSEDEIKRQRRREQGAAQSLEQLIALGKQRGYKNPYVWAQHVFAARTRVPASA